MNELNLSKESASNVVTTISEGILTARMNKPDKLNGWTQEMIDAIKETFAKAAISNDVKVIIFTGTGSYFSAGANLGGSIQLMSPRKLHDMIRVHNQALFEAFLACPKPILAAINGHALGASVTSATLCNGIIAAESATFSTPFVSLGIIPEGCSSVHFPRLLGAVNAQRMLNEGWKPNAKEALNAGLVQWVVPDDQLLVEANRIAKEWIAEGVERKFMAGSQLSELRAANEKESRELADAFLGPKFLKGQGKFLWRKKKHAPAMLFLSVWAFRPLWRLML